VELRFGYMPQRTRVAPSVFREQGIHLVADTIAEVVADDAYSIEPCHQGLTIAGRQVGDGLPSLFECVAQRIEITVILIADIVAEARSPFAVEDHQLHETRRFANSFSVAGDGPLGLDDGSVLAPQYIRPEPTVVDISSQAPT
jgi:hypothetical protein